MKNKYEEALDYLRWIGGDAYYKKQREKSFDVLQELVDKNTPTIIIPLSEYEYLRSRDTRLARLEENGVDNWEWYDECFKEDEE